MLGTAHDPSRRIVYRGLLCFRATALTLLGALVFAGSAYAAQTQETQGSGTGGTLAAETPERTMSSDPIAAPEPAAPAPEAATPAPEAATPERTMSSDPIAAPEPVVATPPETVLSAPTPEKAPETVLAAPPPETATPTPAPEKVPAPTSASETPQKVEQVLPAAPPETKEIKEIVATDPTPEKTQEAVLAGSTPEDPLSGPGILATTPAAPQNIEPHNEAAATEVPGAGSGLLAFARPQQSRTPVGLRRRSDLRRRDGRDDRRPAGRGTDVRAVRAVGPHDGELHR